MVVSPAAEQTPAHPATWPLAALLITCVSAVLWIGVWFAGRWLFGH